MATNSWMLGQNCLDFIMCLLPTDSVILELGSGEGTAVLAERYHVFSVEHDPAWLNRHEADYIYAPLKNGWYCVEMLRPKLPKRYDLLIVDGPPGESRLQMVKHLALFDLNCHIIFDDVNRETDNALACIVSVATKRPLTVFDEPDGRQFGYIAHGRPL